jgi:hypothetical protein
VVDAAGAEPRLGDRESAAFLADEVVDRHPDVGEHHLGVAAVRAVGVAEHPQSALDLDTGRVPRHQHHALLAVRLAVRVRLAHDDEQLAARRQRPGRPPLPAVDHVVVAVALDAGADVASVG